MNKKFLSFLLTLNEKLPKFLTSNLNSLQNDLAKISKTSFEVYLGLLTFTVLVAGITTFSVSLIIIVSFLSLLQALIVSILLGICAGLISVGSFYLYANLKIYSTARKIDVNLPLISNFMAVLANSGMPPERILRSLGNVGDEFGVGEEIRRAVGDVELLGKDLKGALRNASARSSSSKFASLLNGVISTAHVGGDLDAFLREKANVYMKARRLSMKNFLENLNSIAEVYVSFMIALPLTLIIMLSVMSFLGGGVAVFGNLDPYILLMILTFIITPAGVCILLLTVDSLTPPR
ncbi:MAG: type II secretion system F family protein [Candidatus Bathyarchaeota archaeon]|nr:type II secretion system F family protein [Candidatus Bathyarchaeum tardum]WGM90561.1 MAG: type II secretion system F family protein [Candidatus Bathyarchaeum tardum]